VKYCDLLDWIRTKWLGIDKKIVPVSEKLRRDPWGFRQQGWSTPTERPVSTTVNGDCSDISSASTSGVWVWTTEIETVIDIATPRRRLKSFEDKNLLRSCERAQLLAFACEAYFSDIFGNRASKLTVTLFGDRLYNYYNTENIEKISNSFVCSS